MRGSGAHLPVPWLRSRRAPSPPCLSPSLCTLDFAGSKPGHPGVGSEVQRSGGETPSSRQRCCGTKVRAAPSPGPTREVAPGSAGRASPRLVPSQPGLLAAERPGPRSLSLTRGALLLSKPRCAVGTRCLSPPGDAHPSWQLLLQLRGMFGRIPGALPLCSRLGAPGCDEVTERPRPCAGAWAHLAATRETSYPPDPTSAPSPWCPRTQIRSDAPPSEQLRVRQVSHPRVEQRDAVGRKDKDQHVHHKQIYFCHWKWPGMLGMCVDGWLNSVGVGRC